MKFKKLLEKFKDYKILYCNLKCGILIIQKGSKIITLEYNIIKENKKYLDSEIYVKNAII